ncbi:uncharacterized protein E0L32_011498 [Thyridium curvatum]|uniref:CN hydrolase domain-containing protein n=1 Tax=Thyridium curvatum TaxID=1093900 RepID=A0A507BMT7_9PEZI|nr:uncharacterized protein E0L32_011498 [Thyridium curvatum]TPX18819.1 hypothetical protein E0L32_011498 [Thyridium curvatum]
MAPVYKFALIQLKPKPVDPEANFARAEAHIREAAAQGAHVAVLPEYHLTGWVPDHADFVSATRASAAYLARYRGLARELDISIVPGTICEVHPRRQADEPPQEEEEEQEAGRADRRGIEIRNMAYFVAAGTGEVLGAYQKKNLWHPERPHLTSSGQDAHTAFDTPLTWDDDDEGVGGEKKKEKKAVRAGMLVCWDLSFPEAFRELVADGADVVFVPCCWYLSDVDRAAREINPQCERVFLESVTVARACESGIAVVFVNEGGLSRVAMPLVGVVEGSQMEPGAEGMRVVDVDLGVLRVAEGNYRVRKDMMGEGWHYAHTLMRGRGGGGS